MGLAHIRRRQSGLALALHAATSGEAAVLTELPGVDYTQGSYEDFVASLTATGCIVDDLGVCSDGARHVYGLQYGDADKQCVFLVGVLHGAHEWRNAYILRQFMTYLVTPPSGGSGLIAPLLERFQFYAVPCANPHGFDNNDYCNANGVNLNRNFDASWADYDDSADACAAGKGASAFSEVETQYIRDKVGELDVVVFVDFHVLGGGSPPPQVYVFTSGTDFWSEVETAFEADGYTMNMSPYLSDPMAHIWAATQVTANLSYPRTALCEPAEGIASESERSRITMNWLRHTCLYAVSALPGPGILQPAADLGVDTYISNYAADTDYGTAPFLRTGTTTVGTNYRSLIRFDLSGIPAGATITSATLTLMCNEENTTTDLVVGVHRALTEWYEGPNNGAVPGPGEDASTWKHRNANGSVAWGGVGGQPGVDYAESPTDSATITGRSADFEWDVTADVAAFVAGEAANYGWWLINQAEVDSHSRKAFATSDDATQSSRPRLTVTYTT